MDETIQVRKRGRVTLPAELRQKYNIEEGDILHVLDLDGVFVLIPMVPAVPELARQIEKMRLEEGISMQELLEGLRDQRDRSFRERDPDAGDDQAE